MLKLNFRRFGQAGPPLLFLHGLLGDSSNWHGMARRLDGEFHSVLVDLRGHGASPHCAQMDIPSLAQDVAQLLDQLGWAQANLIGHSLGGKVAMWLALTRPQRVSRLLVADIAPVAYPDRYSPLINALAELPLNLIDSRSSADAALQSAIPDTAMRHFLLKNLLSQAHGYRWRVDLDAISANLPALLGFPSCHAVTPAPVPALFLHGGRSAYVQTAHHARIQQLFPQAELQHVVHAGHWPHVDAPDVFAQAVRRWFN